MDAIITNGSNRSTYSSFNPRARDGRDSTRKAQLNHLLSFNPRARDGRDHCFVIWIWSMRCFNPRARDGRDSTTKRRSAKKAVSIHAPVMDAIAAAINLVTVVCFNPRARDGRDF